MDKELNEIYIFTVIFKNSEYKYELDDSKNLKKLYFKIISDFDIDSVQELKEHKLFYDGKNIFQEYKDDELISNIFKFKIVNLILNRKNEKEIIHNSEFLPLVCDLKIEMERIQKKLDNIEKEDYKNKIHSYFEHLIEKINKAQIKLIDIYIENFMKNNLQVKEIKDFVNGIKKNQINKESILEKLEII